MDGFEVKLSWEAPLNYPIALREGLTYNLRVGTSPDGGEVSASHASPVTGYRYKVKGGEIGHRLEFLLKDLPDSTYFWSVQAVEADFEGGPFSVEGTFAYIRPSFVNVTDTGFVNGRPPGMMDAHLSWADIDGDKDLDLLALGANVNGLPQVRLYRNDGTGLENDPVPVSQVTPVKNAAVAWQDVNQDGWMDVLIAGESVNGPTSEYYQNDGAGRLIPVNVGVPDLQNAALAWADFDNDGDVDLAVSGFDGTQFVSGLYQVEDAGFNVIAAGLESLGSPAIAWADYDRDGDQDLLLTGENSGQLLIQLYRNNGDSTFLPVNSPFQAVRSGSLEWGDYDNDGFSDLLLSGESDSGPTTRLYQNDGNGAFTEVLTSLPGVENGHAAWGDYNDDGFRDIVLTGESSQGRLTKLFRNDAGSAFVEDEGNSVLFRNVDGGSHLAWGDVDRDGKLDLALTGRLADSPDQLGLWLYRNIDSATNMVPGPPQNLKEEPLGPNVFLQWDPPANPDVSVSAGYTYQLYMGTRPDSVNVISPNSHLGDGLRMIVGEGSVGQRRSWLIKGLPEGEYYWSVQAVDQDFEASGFTAPIQSFTFEPTVFKDETDSLFQNPNPLNQSALSWGDYDNDGDLDILASGEVDSLLYSASVYRNTGDGFEEDVVSSTVFIGVRKSDAQWGDYNHDGWLDVLLCGEEIDGSRSSQLYRNTGGAFARDSAAEVLADVADAAAGWGDFDNDGDLDILLTGMADSGRVAAIYRNDRHLGFSRDALASSVLTGIDMGDVDWGDFDANGDIDILLSGNADSGPFTQVYRNLGNGQFEPMAAPLIDVKESSVAWGDYDNDGFLDIVLSGESSTSLFDPVSRVYRYVDSLNSFANIGAPLIPVKGGSVDWGDYNDDGYLDILMTGRYAEVDTARTSRVYRNTGAGNFTLELNTSASLENIELGTSAWGDYDNDRKLDIILTGKTSDEPVVRTFAVYRNIDNAPNVVPPDISGLTDSVVGDQVILAWELPDPAAFYSYNLLVGSDVGEEDLISSMSEQLDGYRRIVREGNVGKTSSWRLKDVLPGRYYWQIQSVDADREGSGFSAEIGSFEVSSIQPIIIDSSFVGVYKPQGSQNEAWVEILDTSVVEQVLLHYKGLSEVDWQQEILTSADDFFRFVLVPSYLDEQGMAYFFEAVGKFGFNARTDTVYAMRHYDGKGLVLSDFQTGTTVKDYNILSVPLVLEDSAISQVLEELGTYDIFQWRFWHYQDGQHLEYTQGLSTIGPGKGYWLITRNPLDSMSSGAGTTVYAHDAAPYELNLRAGWNQIGNPYVFNISWSEVLAANPPAVDSLLGDLIRFRNGFVPGDQLDRYEGAFLFADAPLRLKIPIRKNPFIQRSGMFRQEPRAFGTLEGESWQLDLYLASEGYHNRMGGIGMHPLADRSKDRFDAVRAPRLSEYLDLNFDHPEFRGLQFSRDVVPRSKSYVWEFTVEGNLAERIDLKWDHTGFGQGPLQLVLFDVERQRAVDMRSRGQYRSLSETTVRRFRILYGSTEFIQQELEPDFIHLGTAWPNPFQEEVIIPFSLPVEYDAYDVRLVLTDLSGRSIATLLDETLPGGFYKIPWNGSNDSGEKVAQGMYIYQLSVRYVGGSRRMSGKLRKE